MHRQRPMGHHSMMIACILGQSMGRVYWRSAFNMGLAGLPDDWNLERDSLRFLWIDDVKTETPKVIALWFTWVVFGVLTSPFLLNATIRHYVENYSDTYPRFVESFLRSINICRWCDNDDLAYKLYSQSKHILAEAGLNLRKFVSNSATLEQQGRFHEFSLGWAILDNYYYSYFEVEYNDCIQSMPNLGGLGMPQKLFKTMHVFWELI